MSRGRLGCLITLGIIGVALLVAVPWMIQVALVANQAKKAGLLDDVKTDKFQVGRENNLKAIHKALMQAVDSDGQYPEAAKWMDTAKIRLKTSDITPEEAQKKLVVPGNDQGFGYAFNDVFGGKRPEDLKVKKDAVLVYESKQTGWNAHGDPAKDAKPGGKGVTLDGTVVAVGG